MILVTQSIAVIEAGQGTNGAYVACPSYSSYNYCWFRDGTFIAVAMDRWQKHESARRFYDWATALVVARADGIERCLENVAQGRPLNPADLLHTRYTLDGRQGDEDWPNFQLDGFGTLLWGLQHHMQLTDPPTMPSVWARAANLLVRYLAALWQRPNSDCWEEFSDQIAVSTLAALYAGLHAISAAFEANGQDATLALDTARQIKAFLLGSGVRDGHLIKQIEGEDVVDASLLWASVPFQEHSFLQPSDPVMQATVARIEQDLVGKTGGVHRYAKDTFYGGGEWVLLTALLGEYYTATGNLTGGQRCLAFVEASANEQGHLPEQVSRAPLHPEYVEHWLGCWGPVACPLLWSHAAYLSLSAQVRESGL
ncbi:glycoside hydrolase family 15 protein [Ktedonobacter sp. SOSP1-52]|uniref:glycoside hydrolase family 15 protein n=1 Tax=Ktedonobacter sp. SOSP1-52 TaxID=2778366 RepID=UPI0019160620|nr:glycoside hydrolase family 15 protein [Ktedonobacter sp. SOSP1-52]